MFFKKSKFSSKSVAFTTYCKKIIAGAYSLVVSQKFIQKSIIETVQILCGKVISIQYTV